MNTRLAAMMDYISAAAVKRHALQVDFTTSCETQQPIMSFSVHDFFPSGTCSSHRSKVVCCIGLRLDGPMWSLLFHHGMC